MISIEREYFLLPLFELASPSCHLTQPVFAGREGVVNANGSRNAKTPGLLYVILFHDLADNNDQPGLLYSNTWS
jgi:hypothetical protein